MGKLKSNGMMKGASGGYGRQLVFRKGKGQTIIFSSYPARTAQPSEKELKQREKFALASTYAKTVKSSNPSLWAKYEAKAKGSGRSARTFAMQDYLVPPHITQINTTEYNGEVGSKIHVICLDNFEIQSLTVKIAKGDGSLIESGAATDNGGAWSYIATVKNTSLSGCKISVEARDIPGNITERSAVL